MTHPIPPVDSQAAMEAPVLRLPEWNDLTNEQRVGLCQRAEYMVGDTDAQFFAGDIALEIYNYARANVTLELPPLIAAFHDQSGDALSASTRPAEGWRPIIPEGTRMYRISRLIEMLKETFDQLGDTCVYARDLSWGAMALNQRADDEKAGVTIERSAEWDNMPMDRKTIQAWIDKINHEPAREVLRQYLHFKACEPVAGGVSAAATQPAQHNGTTPPSINSDNHAGVE